MIIFNSSGSSNRIKSLGNKFKSAVNLFWMVSKSKSFGLNLGYLSYRFVFEDKVKMVTTEKNKLRMI